MKPIFHAILIAVISASGAAAAFAETDDKQPVAPPPAATDPAKFETADALWDFIESRLEKFQARFTSKEEAMATLRPVLLDLDASLESFTQRFPKDDRFIKAITFRAQMWYIMGDLDVRPFDLAKTETLLNQIINSPDALSTDKADAKFMFIQLATESLGVNANEATAKSLEQKILAFLKDHPNDRRNDMLKLAQARVVGSFDKARQEQLLNELAENNNIRVAMAAKQELQALSLKKTPLDLKFTDITGKEVDMTKLRGKVVLIDFWATWCKPCIMDLPNVLAAHKKYSDKGLEIVGISWDESKEDLLAFVKQHGMNWPNYFEVGAPGGADAISRRFNIMGIPTQWLVDKKGFVRSTEARGDLDTQIAKLLAE